MPAVTFYGHFTGWGSYPTVCREIARWLHGRPTIKLRLCDLREEGKYELVEDIERVPEPDRRRILFTSWSARNGGSPNRSLSGGVGLLFGFPEWHRAIPRHQLNVGYHVCDTHKIPPHWVNCINGRADRVIVPSEWCRRALRRSGVGRRPIKIVHHGVSDCFGLRSKCSSRAEGSDVRLRHLSSDGSWQRKGSGELLEALSDDVLEELGAHLYLQDRQRELVDRVGDRVTVVTRGPGPQMKLVRDLWDTDLLVQPSRGEGFGMTPLEALSSGVPVVATTCTGHAEHLDSQTPGLMPVLGSGLDRCSDGYGMAPGVSADSIRRSVKAAVHQLAELAEAAKLNARSVKARWSWDSVLTRGRLVELLTP